MNLFDEESIQQALTDARRRKIIYLNKSYKKWVCSFSGLLIGVGLTAGTIEALSLFSNAIYSRVGVDYFSDCLYKNL